MQIGSLSSTRRVELDNFIVQHHVSTDRSHRIFRDDNGGTITTAKSFGLVVRRSFPELKDVKDVTLWAHINTTMRKIGQKTHVRRISKGQKKSAPAYDRKSNTFSDQAVRDATGRKLIPAGAESYRAPCQVEFFGPPPKLS